MADPLKIYKALADETRLRLLRLLARGSLNVNEIIGVMQMGQSRVSRHLKILTEAGLVTGRREGTWIYYEEHRNGDELVADTLAHLSAHEQELAHFANDMEGLEASIENRKRKTTAYFDSLRDTQACPEHPGVNGEQYRQIAAALVKEGHNRILDMGTGSGLLLPALLQKADSIIAVDASVTMLDLAKKTVGTEVAHCDFRLGDLEHLPVADGEADAVMACMVLHHVSRPLDALVEAYRVLAPGGRLIVVDFYQHEDESFREHLADLWLGFQPTQLKQWTKTVGFGLIESKTVSLKQKDNLKLITLKGQKP